MAEFDAKIADLDAKNAELAAKAESAGLPAGQYSWLNRLRRAKAMKDDIDNL